MWTESSSVNSANLVNIFAIAYNVRDINFFPRGYFFGSPYIAHILHCVQKNTHSHFLSYLYELCVDLNKNCSEYTQGKVDSDNIEIRY